jgi:uncharacterized protein involved in response to NO
MQEILMLRVRPESPRIAILDKGFRPFFLLAALWAAAIVPAWLLVLGGQVSVGPYLSPVYWHAHEMVFGFATAVVAGFLLTAAGNWTKRETAVGLPLLALALLWVAGRVVLLASGSLPPWLVAGVSLAFIPALAFAVGRVVLEARSRRNYAFVIVLAALWAAQLAVHLDALGVAPGGQRIGAIVGVDLLILLVLVIGGRVIPMFTRNATGVEVRTVRALDVAAIASVALLAVLDASGATGRVPAALSGLAAIFAAARAVRWGSHKIADEPLLWVLHVGYAWVPFGLALRALSEVVPVITPSLATHALTVGALGTVTLGMMVRVALGHTGRMLRSPIPTTLAFAFVSLAALARVFAPLLGPDYYVPSLHLSGGLWALAFVLYAVCIGPMLVRARVDGKPG